MKTKLLLLAVSAAAFSSCTTMYKSGQTPDDVYYSPARNYGEAVAVAKRPPAEEPVYNYSGEDRVILMGINDYRWRYLNNDYAYSPYSYYDNYSAYNRHGYYNNYGGYSNNYGNFYSPYYSDFYSNYYYNPYYSPYPVYITPASSIKNTTPRVTNLNGYTHHYNNNNASFAVPNNVPVRSYNNTNARTSALGNVLNKVLAPANNNNSYNNTTNRTTTTTERTYTPPPASSSSSSSGSSSSGGGGGRITRPN
ncbi:hypothetical protein [Ferruginibacter sp.]|uniref:hypothetical protein n=1 Tax=Ferruginibacter sp. TaxID=1940288 RepID=UPI002659B158|nr:hypothetical protein [Ferruginibacter sp.]